MGSVSSLPERYGVDFLFNGNGDLVGVQRKEVKDWIASIYDGRLKREQGQVRASPLARTILLLEGHLNWTTDGRLVGQHTKAFTFSLHLSQLLSMMGQGWSVLSTSNLSETEALLSGTETYLCKKQHHGLTRPGPRGEWGMATSRDWAVHLLEGFEGIGREVANNILDMYGASVLQWTVSEAELLKVPGIGKVRAGKLIRALEAGQ